MGQIKSSGFDVRNFPGFAQALCVAGLCAALAACTAASGPLAGAAPEAEIANAAPPPGDPAEQHVGKPYQIAGNWYHPQPDPDYDRTGLASWYGPGFHGRRTANGEVFDQSELTAAHPTLPLPSYVRVTNLDNDRSLIVRVNDRGPFHRGRLIDVSARAAELLGFKRSGSAEVRVEYVDAAAADADDERYLMASYRGPHPYPSVEDASTIAVASAETPRRRPQSRPAESEPAITAVAAAEARPAAIEPAAIVASVPQARPLEPQAVAFAAAPEANRPASEAVSAMTDSFEADDRISMVFELLPDGPQ